MEDPVHFIVARSRHGWGVNVGADRLSDHPDADSARKEAAMLVEASRRGGLKARLVDLSKGEDAPEKA
jgi:hypothetical protein